MSQLENKYNLLRKKLDCAGYQQPLSFGSMDLVYNLLNDFLHYQSGYTSFKEMADELFQQFSVLKHFRKSFGSESKNIQYENNLDLQRTQDQDGFINILKRLKSHITEFQKDYSDMELVNRQHLKRIGELEEEISLQNQKLIKFEAAANSVKDKCTDFKTDGTKNKSRQTISDDELDTDCKFMGKVEEHYKQKNLSNLSQYLVKNGREDIVPLQCAFEKMKAERDYYCKEYHLLHERIFQLYIENCSLTEKEKALCFENIKDCQGDHLRFIIRRIGKLLRCQRSANNIKLSELEMAMAHRRVEQKIQEIKKCYQNLSSNESELISENKCLQECLLKKEEALRTAISSQQKTQVKLNDAVRNLVAMSRKNDCLKDKMKQRDDNKKKMEKKLVFLSNSIKALFELKQKAETEVNSFQKRTDEFENEMKKLKQELCRYSFDNDRLAKENKHLVVRVTKLTKHIRQLNQNLDLRKQRIKDLKREMHHYISEVRKVEEAIESKEEDLQRILETYSVASDEETFALANKELLERDENSVTECYANIDIGLNNFESIEKNVYEPQELQK